MPARAEKFNFTLKHYSNDNSKGNISEKRWKAKQKRVSKNKEEYRFAYWVQFLVCNSVKTNIQRCYQRFFVKQYASTWFADREPYMYRYVLLICINILCPALSFTSLPPRRLFCLFFERGAKLGDACIDKKRIFC